MLDGLGYPYIIDILKEAFMPTTLIMDSVDEFLWDSIETVVDDFGELQSEKVIYDNLVEVFKKYHEGNLTNIWVTDVEGTGSNYEWESINTIYSGGLLLTKEIVYDNGIVTSLRYSNGFLESRVVYDADDGAGGLADWEAQVTTYEVNGDTESTHTIYDNGENKYVAYYENQIVSVHRQDDSEAGTAYEWQQISTSYSNDGKISTHFVYFDNGSVIQLHYGIEHVEYKIDILKDDSGELLHNRQMRYDENGDLHNLWNERADGTFAITEYYTDGARFVLQGDNEDDMFPWDLIFEYFDPTGTTVARNIVFDNQDELLNLYDGGVVQNQLLVDGDNSHSWYAREFIFDDNGIIIQTLFYDTVDDVPAYFDVDHLFVFNN
jgi:hypothetical protein